MLWTTCAIIFIIMALVTVIMSFLIKNSVIETKYSQAIKAAEMIEEMTFSFPHDNHSSRYYNSSLETISKTLDSEITVIQKNGAVFASTNHVTGVSPHLVSPVLSGETITKKDTFGSTHGEQFYIIGVPLKHNNEIVGGVFFNTSTPAITRASHKLFMMLLFVCIIALLVAFILIFIHTKKTVKPLREINKAVLEIASGNFSKRLTPGKDEIGQIASSFNYMASTLEKLENMRAEFVSDISHELRTPMTSISGFISGILDGTIPPEKEKEYLNIVYNESKRLAKLTNDMLDMSKMTSSEYQLDITEFDINELVRLCIIQLEQKISDKQLELDVVMPDGKLMVLADKGSIQRVIINILDNAIKFSFEDTTMKISVIRKATKAYVSIGNLGFGIDEKDINNIFDRFFKSDKSRTNNKSGAGLGLSLTKNIINLHNQDIWVESITTGKDAKFTTFTFTLELL